MRFSSLQSRFKIEQGQLVRKQTQADSDAIKNANAELRKNPDALRNLSFGALALKIPEIDLYVLWKKYPELNSTDRMTRRNAWRRFINSSEADPFRVRTRTRKARL